MTFLLDSVVFIDHFNGVSQATRFIESHAAELAVSSITRAEVLAGFADEDVSAGRMLLDRFRFLPMDVDISDEAARVRRRTRLKLPDAIQAAFAIRHGLKLVTRNVKDYPLGKFDFVIVPYR